MSVPELPETQRFYDDLAASRVRRGLWGYERRFAPDRIREKPSVRRHFEAVVAPFIGKSDAVLDLGCGPGGFLAIVAPRCREIVGVDVSPGFVDRCRATIAAAGLTNASARWSPDGRIPFPDATFDVVFMVDTIHHCADPAEVIEEVRRVLKPNGWLLVHEPNKLNPALAVMCAFDRNEWGLLALGTHRAYRHLLEGRFGIESCAWNGLLVGPDAPLAVRIADAVSSGWGRALLGWLSPKIFIAARRTDGGRP